MQLKQFINESLGREYAYRVKIAADCTKDHLSHLEEMMTKYDIQSIAAWKRTPIQENPTEFVRIKGVNFTSEVCSTDVVLKYPVNERIMEVYIAANLNIDPTRIIVQKTNDPRKAVADAAGARVVADKDRYAQAEDAVLSEEEQAHYEQQELDEMAGMYGEAYNTKFLEMLKKIREEKGADYFRCYPTKGDLMGDTHREYMDTLMNTPNQGKGETAKTVDVINQSR
jgi:hypothetical protein